MEERVHGKTINHVANEHVIQIHKEEKITWKTEEEKQKINNKTINRKGHTSWNDNSVIVYLG